MKFLKVQRYLTLIRKFEKSTNQMNNPVEVGLIYLDLCMSVNDLAGLTGYFIMSGIHFFKELISSSNPKEIYAYRNGVFYMMINDNEIKKNLTPTTQLYIYKMIMVLIIKSN
jgi:hypothetical protein